MVERFGGEKLYGNDPSAALREFLQNAVDAIHACRKLGGLGEEEGEIEIAFDDIPDGHWVHITDTGIGMSRYVLTEVLLDFGRSLWRSPELRGEWSSLSASGFEAIGQFGIGFFSVFMLGQRVRVVTRRYESKEGESEQWVLEFSAGTDKRPILRVPSGSERLKRHGTRLSVLISKEKMLALCNMNSTPLTMSQLCAHLAPAVDINIFVRDPEGNRHHVVKANDWKTIPPIELLKRIAPSDYKDANPNKFGHWSHLSELYDSNGNVIGRCAIKPESYFYNKLGIGVVKGLYAASTRYLAGVVFSKPQSDLARKTATPDVALLEVQRWANEQKNLLHNCGQIDGRDSALLASFGADHTNLIIGNLGGEALSYEEFVQTIQTMPLIKIHDEEISHEDDDDVLWKDFSNYFEVDKLLLELSSQRGPDWLKQINNAPLIMESWSLDTVLDTALKEAWGEVDWDEGDTIVGSVNGTDIIRSCKIAKPIQQDDSLFGE